MSRDRQALCGASRTFWERRWNRARGENLAIASQRRHPGAWRRFYEETGPMLEAVRGFAPSAAPRAAAVLERLAGLSGSERVVDIGCGRGWLALALAARGLRVLAVDLCRSSLAALEERARRKRLAHLRTRCVSWRELPLDRRADLVVAAFFPQAWTPWGFRRLERIGRRCAVVWGEGIRALPWTSGLWRRLVGSSPAAAGEMGCAAVNWLLATGRPFGLERVLLPLRVDLQAEDLFAFYRRYFALLDCSPARIEEALSAELGPRLRRGRLQAGGSTAVGFLVWRRPSRGGRRAH